MHLSQHNLCTRETELALGTKFYLDFRRVCHGDERWQTSNKWRQIRISAESLSRTCDPRKLCWTPEMLWPSGYWRVGEHRRSWTRQPRSSVISLSRSRGPWELGFLLNWTRDRRSSRNQCRFHFRPRGRSHLHVGPMETKGITAGRLLLCTAESVVGVHASESESWPRCSLNEFSPSLLPFFFLFSYK